ncbi:DNA-directed RNA polymerase subunit omega [Deinococcus roseus]|uniref:DNA-directed RNA polymerase subunit omega n=1 Tax=Deinococcus roseus TaxID=392414 RepID=A0ABQ2D459_9DEIO|nr:DNA-directed RNA polymerase subunit omega [Deinococcus roseus]GGJ37873.1 DNA-directed RNA polymerase subunit omega [Deinococcus roseus]
MAEPNIDKMLALTNSKYSLSVVVAKRALQLKAGTPSALPVDQRAKIRNLVTVAMRELASGKLQVGENLIDEEKLAQDLQRTKQALLQAQTVHALERD